MNICSENHPEIVYEDEECPLCIAMDEIKELEKKVAALETSIGEA